MNTNLPSNINTLVTGLTNVMQRGAITDTSGMSYMKFDKAGYWLYGTDDTEVEEGSVWAVNPNSFQIGFIAWGAASNVLGEEMASVTDDPLIASNLPDVGAVWQQQIAMQLVCISGEDKGQQALYKSSSGGGKKRFNEFLQAVLAQLTGGTAGDKVVPLVILDGDSYKHKKYGTIHQPLFLIDGWATMEDSIDSVTESAEPEPAQEPEPEPEPKPEPVAAPRKRRRTRKSA